MNSLDMDTLLKSENKNLRTILHSDINNFYASVECMLNPDLKDKYVAVCGNREDRHGIVLAKNQKAKMCGVMTGETIWQAQAKCPELIIVPPHFDQYLKYSELVHQIYLKYTNLVEPFGMDECWLDVTGSRMIFGDGETIADKIREDVKSKTGLTVSIGVSFNKIFAKLGSDMKKPDAVTVIPYADFKSKVWSLPACELLGVGRATYKKLKANSIYTIGDIATTPLKYLKSKLGKWGETLWIYANGYENSPVYDYEFDVTEKSIGHGVTLVCDLTEDVQVWNVIYKLCENISHRLRARGLYAGSVALSVKDTYLKCEEHQAPLDTQTQSMRDIAKGAFELFKKNYDFSKNVRALSVRAINLTSKKLSVQTSIFCDETKRKKQEKAEAVLDKLQQKYGTYTVCYASLTGNLNMPKGSDKKIILPSPLKR